MRVFNDILHRFCDQVTLTPTCWIWNGYSPDGYGRIKVGNASKMAHRVSYEMFVGKIPDGLTIDHLCKNRLCVKPTHLEAVTPGENTARSGAWEFRRSMTTCMRGHPFDYVNSQGKRHCRTCANERQRANAARGRGAA